MGNEQEQRENENNNEKENGNEFTDRAMVQVKFCSHFSFSHSLWSFPISRSSFYQPSNNWIDVMLPSRERMYS